MAYNDLFKAGNFVLQFKNKRKLEFSVQEVSIPGLTMGTMETFAPSVQKEKRPGDMIEWNDLTMTVIADEDMEAFDEARESIIEAFNPNTGDLNIEDIYFDGYLMLTTNKNNVFRKYIFHDCWISSLGDLPLSTTSSEDETPVFDVTVIFTHYEKVKD